MRLIDADEIPTLFDEKFKETRKLIQQGETHLDNLAEGFTEADRVIRQMPTVAHIENGKIGFALTAKGERHEKYNEFMDSFDFLYEVSE